jgi:hypothetical protein
MEHITTYYFQLNDAEKAEVKNLIIELSNYSIVEGLEETHRILTETAPNDVPLEHCQQFVFETYYSFFFGFSKFNEGAYVEAREMISKVYTAASQITDLQDLALESDSLCSYITGLIEIHNGNLQRGVDSLNNAQKVLKAQQNYHKYQDFIESSECEVYFISAVLSLQQLDYATAKGYANQAGEKASAYAKKYGVEDSFTLNQFEGLSNYYKAYIDFYLGERDITAYYFNSLVLKNRVAGNGFDLAIKYFDNIVQSPQAISFDDNIYNQAKAFACFSTVQSTLAQLMFQKIKGETIQFDFDELRQQLFDIQVFINKIKHQSIVFIHLKTLLEQRIDQMEKWA